jgi:hypothetical protein
LQRLIELGNQAALAVSGCDLRDQTVAMDWSSIAQGVGRSTSLGRRKRAGDLARFDRSLRLAEEIDVIFGWHAPVRPEGMDDIEMPGTPFVQTPGVIDLTARAIWWGTRPHLSLQWLWADRAGIGLASQVQDATIGIARQVASQMDVMFLHLTDDQPGTSDTALDIFPGRSLPDILVEPGQLRTYSWVTYVSAGQAATAGGVEHLASCGAFYEVTPAGAGYLLRATQHLADYAGPPVRAVREALKPILPQGPEMFRNDPDFRLAWDDGTNGPFKVPRGNSVE